MRLWSKSICRVFRVKRSVALWRSLRVGRISLSKDLLARRVALFSAAAAAREAHTTHSSCGEYCQWRMCVCVCVVALLLCVVLGFCAAGEGPGNIRIHRLLYYTTCEENRKRACLQLPPPIVFMGGTTTTTHGHLQLYKLDKTLMSLILRIKRPFDSIHRYIHVCV